MQMCVLHSYQYQEVDFAEDYELCYSVEHDGESAEGSTKAKD